MARSSVIGETAAPSPQALRERRHKVERHGHTGGPGEVIVVLPLPSSSPAGVLRVTLTSYSPAGKLSKGIDARALPSSAGDTVAGFVSAGGINSALPVNALLR